MEQTNIAYDDLVKFIDIAPNWKPSEIYATWSDAAIRANILAIMSFTLNRVYTELPPVPAPVLPYSK